MAKKEESKKDAPKPEAPKKEVVAVKELPEEDVVKSASEESRRLAEGNLSAVEVNNARCPKD